jgi:hypothetical protein
MQPPSTQSPDELARRAVEVFQLHIRPRLQPSDEGKFLAIHLDSGEFEIDEDDYAAVTLLRERCPAGEVWLMQTDGSPAYFMGHLE